MGGGCAWTGRVRRGAAGRRAVEQEAVGEREAPFGLGQRRLAQGRFEEQSAAPKYEEVSGTRRVFSGSRSSTASMPLKKTASSSRTNSETPTASMRSPSWSVVVVLRTSHSSSRTRICAPGREPGPLLRRPLVGHSRSLPLPLLRALSPMQVCHGGGGRRTGDGTGRAEGSRAVRRTCLGGNGHGSEVCLAGVRGAHPRRSSGARRAGRPSPRPVARRCPDARARRPGGRRYPLRGDLVGVVSSSPAPSAPCRPAAEDARCAFPLVVSAAACEDRRRVGIGARPRGRVPEEEAAGR